MSNIEKYIEATVAAGIATDALEAAHVAIKQARGHQAISAACDAYKAAEEALEQAEENLRAFVRVIAANVAAAKARKGG